MVRWNTSIFPVYADAGAAMDGEDVLLREITLEAHDTLSETDKLGAVVRENGVGQSVLIRSLDRPYKGLIPACVLRRTEFYFSCITCPTARKRASVVLTKVFLYW